MNDQGILMKFWDQLTYIFGIYNAHSLLKQNKRQGNPYSL